jgi:tetratricopeptide (TPR) repeat protein
MVNHDDDEPRESHLTPMALARLLTGRMEAEEIRGQLVPHLLRQCPGWREVDARLQELVREVGHWDEVLAVSEGTEAPELWRGLEQLGQRQQIELVESEARYQTWGLCRLLLRRGGEAVADHPETSARLASLAVRIAGHLGEAYDPAWVSDLRSLALAHLGDARRALGELQGARDAVESARTARAAGTGFPAVEAEALALEALLLRDERRLGEAAALLERVHAIYAGGTGEAAMLLDRAHAIYSGAAGGKAEGGEREAAEPHLAGRALAHQAWCLHHLGQPEAATAALGEAARLIEEAREPRLALAVRHGRVWSALARGRFEEAESLFPKAMELAARLGDEAVRLRLLQAEARLEAAGGEWGPVVKTLRAAFEGFVELDQGVDASLALLDLGALYAATGDGEALARLAADEAFLPFSASDTNRITWPVMLLFQEACRDNRLTRELARHLASMLEKQRRPSLAWWAAPAIVQPQGMQSDAAPAA